MINLKTRNLFSVIGIGFGDEGKGTVVDYIASKNEHSVVYRHSGGHQVGHTVKIGDKLHEFRHFGSGTLRGVPTIWGENCTVSPLQFEIEFKKLKNNFGLKPLLYCHKHSPVTTIYDIAYNRAKEKYRKHGSVGVGFAATLVRHELLPLFVMDLEYKGVLENKLNNISSYYFKKTDEEGFHGYYYNELGMLNSSGYDTTCFLQSAEFLIDNVKLYDDKSSLKAIDYDTVIFEGNQGILLDKHHGFFPNVTYGYTTNKTIPYDNLKTFYVSRVYATRHGHGAMLNENIELPSLINTEFEQNHLNPYQDDFRIAMLDYDMVKYAIECDKSYGKNFTSYLVFTCMDQYVNPKMTKNGEVVDFNPTHFNGIVDRIFTNTSPESKTIKEWKMKF